MDFANYQWTFSDVLNVIGLVPSFAIVFFARQQWRVASYNQKTQLYQLRYKVVEQLLRESEAVISSPSIGEFSIREHTNRMRITGKEALFLFALADRFDETISELISSVAAYHLCLTIPESAGNVNAKALANALLKVRAAQKELREKAFPYLYIGKTAGNLVVPDGEAWDLLKLILYKPESKPSLPELLEAHWVQRSSTEEDRRTDEEPNCDSDDVLPCGPE